MYKLSKSRVITILAICAAGIFFAVPNIVPNKDMLPSWWQPINLGLDLQGGSNLLLEVKLDDVLKERMASNEDAARQILRENRIRYKSLTSNQDGVKVAIENASSRTKAANLFRKIDDGIVVEESGDGVLNIHYNDAALAQLKRKIVDQSIEIVRRRIDELGTKEPLIQSQGADRIVVQLPGLQNPEYVKTLLGKTAKMSFHLVDSSARASDAKRGKLGGKYKLAYGEMGEPYVITRKPVVGGEDLVDAQPSFQEGQAVVSFRFNSRGGKKFGEVTRDNIGERLAIVLDNEVISAPVIQSAIMGGSGVITGNFTDKNGVMKDDGRKNYGLELYLAYRLKEKLVLTLRASHQQTNIRNSKYGSYDTWLQMNPYDSPYDKNGELRSLLSWDMTNPLYEASLSSFSTEETRTQNLSLSARYNFKPNLYITAQGSLLTAKGTADDFVSPLSMQFKDVTDPLKKGSYTLTNNDEDNYSFKVVGNWIHSFDNDGTLFTLNVGGEIKKENSSSRTSIASGFLSDNLTDFGYAASYSDTTPYGSEDLATSVGAFAAANFTWKNRYIIDGSYRMSGSSKFGENNKYAPFWSVGAGYNLHNEEFIKQLGWVDMLRLRGSYGYTGSVKFSPYQAISTYKYYISNIN